MRTSPVRIALVAGLLRDFRCGFRFPEQCRRATPARELVNKYCVSCHNEKLKTANLALDRADAEHPSNSAGDLGKGHREAAKPCDAAARNFRARITPPTIRLPPGWNRKSIARPRLT